jgi:hypothetical protein
MLPCPLVTGAATPLVANPLELSPILFWLHAIGFWHPVPLLLSWSKTDWIIYAERSSPSWSRR